MMLAGLRSGAGPCGVSQGRAGFADDAPARLDRSSLALDEVPDRDAVDELEDEAEVLGRVDDRVYLDDVGMSRPRQPVPLIHYFGTGSHKLGPQSSSSRPNLTASLISGFPIRWFRKERRTS